MTGKPGCGWRAATAYPWLNTLSTGVSDGIVYIAVDANRSLSSRAGTVSIGNETFTIVQAAVGIAALDARATSPTAVSLTWTFSLSPDHYEVWRNDGTGFLLVGSPVTTAFTDTSAPSRSGLVYRVRAVMSDSTTSSFAAEYAHTFTLTDPSLVALPIRERTSRSCGSSSTRSASLPVSAPSRIRTARSREASRSSHTSRSSATPSTR